MGLGLGFGPGDPLIDPLELSQVLIHRHLQNLQWLSQFHREEVIQCPPGSREARKVKEDGHFSQEPESNAAFVNTPYTPRWL